jgi:DNA gyrase/topoisomerase IV subunit B
MNDNRYVSAVRSRPGMYVGDVSFFGFINYLVDAVSLLLSHRPTQLNVGLREGVFELRADSIISMEESPDGELNPFERVGDNLPGFGVDGLVLNALSETLSVEVDNGNQLEIVKYRRGERIDRRMVTSEDGVTRTTLRFVPDSSIFSTTSISPAIFHSYLRRLSFLYQGVRFVLTAGDKSREYYAADGIIDLFNAASAPYQVLHEPIHIRGEEADLKLEAVLAFHSWTDDVIWCYINRGRAVEGGTHEKGLKKALDQLYKRFKQPPPSKGSKKSRMGVIAVVSMLYPHATWEGCIKARIANPELERLVRDLVVSRACEFVDARPELAMTLKQMSTFRFLNQWAHPS